MNQPPPRIYTPDATGRCTGCVRPEDEHEPQAFTGTPRACPPAELAAQRCETDAAIGSPVEVVDVDLTDDDILDFADKIRALVVRAIGEEEDMPPSHLLGVGR